MLSIGVIQNWGLGDLLMTTPVLRELRQSHPSARIILIVRGKAQAALLADSPLIDEILVMPPNSDILGLLRLFWQLRLRGIEVAYIATRITPLVALLLKVVSGVGTIIGDSTKLSWLYAYHSEIDPRVHRVDRMLATLALWTQRKVGYPEFQVPINEKASLRAAEIVERDIGAGRTFIVIHPGSSKGIGVGKRLPTSFAKNVVREIDRLLPHVRVVILLGPDDIDLLPQYQGATDGSVLLSGLSLDETKSVLSRASGFIGSDSALGHIAAAYGIPTITCVGPTNPDETRPYGAKSVVLRSDEDLSCRPCWFTPLYHNCPYDRRCMTGISVAKVSGIVGGWIEGKELSSSKLQAQQSIGDPA